jgi:hypothetical protein
MVNPPPQLQIVGAALVHSAGNDSLSAQARPLDEGGALSQGSELPAQHTHAPGPWDYTRSTSDCCHYEVFAVADSDTVAGEFGIEKLEDAKLIAAAPCMLAALRKIEMRAFSDAPAEEMEDVQRDLRHIYEYARAAIERATGAQHDQ